MQLLNELLQINRDIETASLLEDLGNLGKLGLGSMVNAFKQTYSVYTRSRRTGGGRGKNTTPTDKKFNHYSVGKDSETVEGGTIKNWPGLKKVYMKYRDDGPIAAIFSIDNKPVSLLIASEHDLSSINDKVGLAWDFSKLDLSEDEMASLTKGLNSKSDDNAWRETIVGTDKKPGVSAKTDKTKEENYNFQKGEYDVKFASRTYAGFVQTVREIVPFINNLAKTFGSRLDVKLILADKTRSAKRNQRSSNRPINPEDLKLFTDDIKTRLAKYKNTKVASAEDAKDFIDKVFGGGLKKIKFMGSTYSTIPERKHIGSSSSNSRRGGYTAFYNGTFNSLFKGDPVTIEFEADRAESDYSTLYLTVKMVNGTLKPVEMRYTDKSKGGYGSAETVKF